MPSEAVHVNTFAAEDFPLVINAWAATPTGPELVWALTVLGPGAAVWVPPLARLHGARVHVAVMTPTEFEVALKGGEG